MSVLGAQQPKVAAEPERSETFYKPLPTAKLLTCGRSQPLMKCDLCGAKIEVTFLQKIKGAYVYDAKHKKRAVCPACQKGKNSAQLRAALG